MGSRTCLIGLVAFSGWVGYFYWNFQLRLPIIHPPIRKPRFCLPDLCSTTIMFTDSFKITLMNLRSSSSRKTLKHNPFHFHSLDTSFYFCDSYLFFDLMSFLCDVQYAQNLFIYHQIYFLYLHSYRVSYDNWWSAEWCRRWKDFYVEILPLCLK